MCGHIHQPKHTADLCNGSELREKHDDGDQRNLAEDNDALPVVVPCVADGVAPPNNAFGDMQSASHTH